MKRSRLSAISAAVLLGVGASLLSFRPKPEHPSPIRVNGLSLKVSRDQYALVGHRNGAGPGQAVGIAFGYQEERGYAARFEPGTDGLLVSLLKQADPQAAHSELLTSGSFALNNGSRPDGFVIKRRRDDIAIEVNGRLIVWALDDTFHAGRAGLTKGSPAVQLRKMPISSFAFGEDFTDFKNAPSRWRDALGKWKLDLKYDPYQAHLGNPPNEVRYAAATAGEAIAVAGRALWDNYDLVAHCLPSVSGCFGIVFNYQDNDNYVALICDGERAVVECVQRGRRSIAAQADGLDIHPGLWCELRIITADGLTWAFINGDRLFRVRLPAGPTSGRIGLYSIGGPHLFDDIEARSVVTFLQDFDEPLSPRWKKDDAGKAADLHLTLPADFRAAAQLRSLDAPVEMVVQPPRPAPAGSAVQPVILRLDGETACLLHGGKRIASIKVKPSEMTPTLEFEVRGEIARARACGLNVGKLIAAVEPGSTLQLRCSGKQSSRFSELEIMPLPRRREPTIFDTRFRKLRADHDALFVKSMRRISGRWRLKRISGRRRSMIPRPTAGTTARILLPAPRMKDVAIAAEFNADAGR